METKNTTQYIIERERIKTAGGWIATGSEPDLIAAQQELEELRKAYFDYPNWRIVRQTATTTREVIK